MNNDTPKLCQQQTLAFARSVLQRHLALEANGYLCTTEEMLDILLMMAAKRDTLESTCAELDLVSSAEAYRRHLHLNLERLDAVEHQVNQALQAAIPEPIRQRLSERAHDIACDFNDQPS